jgi:aminopeptidase N
MTACDRTVSSEFESGPGVPLSLAEERVRTISDLRYDLELRIPEALGDPVAGRVAIRFHWRGEGPLLLDFASSPDRVGSIRVNDLDSVEVDLRDEHLWIAGAHLEPGENLVEIEFRAGDGSLNWNEEFLYTLFVPDRARWAFPCFDQPDLKARYALTLHVPEGWRAVANGEMLEEVVVEPLPDGPGGTTLRFAPTEPLSTYLFSFAAGRFDVEEAVRDGRRLQLFHRETDSEKVARNLDAIFDLHATALAWLEDYTGIQYPFGKFDFVAVPSFQYGGMEHAGAILYRASSLFLEESTTQAQLLGRASVIAHETAHMWFGDLVTMRWFDDVWMKEVFANFMAAKIVNPSFPELNHDLRFLLAHYPAAYSVDRTEGANPIRQPLENLNEAGTLYGAIIYQKAPIVMRQLERLVGETELRDGLREYLNTYRFGNAGWPDLIEILDRRSPLDLAAWSRAWVEEPGRPTVTVEISRTSTERRADDGAGPRSEVTVRQSDPMGRGLVWSQPLGFTAGTDEGSVTTDMRLEGEAVSFELEPLEPDFVLANGAGTGYGLFRLTEGSRGHLLRALPTIEEPIARAVAWLSLWDELLEGTVSPAPLVDIAQRAIESEAEELLLSRILADVETAYWRFLSPAERTSVGPVIERLLWSGLESAPTSTLKASYFRAYGRLGLTDEAVGRLKAIWSGDLEISGLPLSEPDYVGLAYQLALRDVPEADDILARQEERIENPDRKARFAFVRTALSADPAVRDGFFEALSDPANREREPWVLQAVGYLHHPLRAEHAVRYLRPSLELLEEIQRTGDIFFPKRWLDATLGGHSSVEAAEIVRAFLAERPDYAPRLRAKILQSADMLFRSARLRG